jgi:hypothetical protein
MVSLVQVSQYTVISAWNSMITPAVKWFVNGDIMTINKRGLIVFGCKHRSPQMTPISEFRALLVIEFERWAEIKK